MQAAEIFEGLLNFKTFIIAKSQGLGYCFYSFTAKTCLVNFLSSLFEVLAKIKDKITYFHVLMYLHHVYDTVCAVELRSY